MELSYTRMTAPVILINLKIQKDFKKMKIFLMSSFCGFYPKWHVKPKLAQLEMQKDVRGKPRPR